MRKQSDGNRSSAYPCWLVNEANNVCFNPRGARNVVCNFIEQEEEIMNPIAINSVLNNKTMTVYDTKEPVFRARILPNDIQAFLRSKSQRSNDPIFSTSETGYCSTAKTSLGIESGLLRCHSTIVGQYTIHVNPRTMEAWAASF
jgi:hypothetical protein